MGKHLLTLCTTPAVLQTYSLPSDMIPLKKHVPMDNLFAQQEPKIPGPAANNVQQVPLVQLATIPARLAHLVSTPLPVQQNAFRATHLLICLFNSTDQVH